MSLDFNFHFLMISGLCHKTGVFSFFYVKDFSWGRTDCLKLYCRYEYTRPYMINRIWSLKQL